MYASKRPAVTAPNQQMSPAHARALALSGSAPSGPILRNTMFRVRGSTAKNSDGLLLYAGTYRLTSMLRACSRVFATSYASCIRSRWSM
jgi:hypothetical protein